MWLEGTKIDFYSHLNIQMNSLTSKIRNITRNIICPKIMNSQKIDSIFNSLARAESNKQLSSKDQKISELKTNRVLKILLNGEN